MKMKESGKCIIGFLGIWLFFYAELLQGGIATHDELLSIAQSIEGTNSFSFGVRMGNFFHYPITLLQTSMPNYEMYRLWTIIGLMIACVCAMIIIYRHVDKKLCWIFPILFVLLAQIELEHDGLLAFGWGYQCDIAFVFISVESFIIYKKTGKKRYNVLSAVIYLVATITYEAFAAFGILFFLLDFIYVNREKNTFKIKLRILIDDIMLHFILVFFYTALFMFLSKFYDAGDAVVGNETSIIGFWKTLKSYSIGLFPLRYKPYSFMELLKRSFDISWNNLALWFIIIFFTKIIINNLRVCKEISKRTYIEYSAICLAGVVLPNVVISLTSKFQNWTFSGIKTFGSSYYSYYFLIFWIIVTIVYIYSKIKYKNCFMYIVFWGIAFTARFTLVGNDYYLSELNKNQNRYEAFMDAIHSEYFGELPDGAQIYTDDYVGIHLNIDSLSKLATSVSHKQVKVINDSAQIDWNKPVYYLDYDSKINGTYLFEMIDDKIAKEVYIQTKDMLEYYYCLFNTQSDEALPLYINETLIGAYRKDVITHGLYTESNNILCKNERIYRETFQIKKDNNTIDTSIFSFDGIYDFEGWGRWSQGTYSIIIDNTDNEESCELIMILTAGIHEDTELDVEYSGEHKLYEIPRDGIELHIPVPLTSGINQIYFNSKAQDLDVPADPRSLNMQIYKMDINYGGETYKYCQ